MYPFTAIVPVSSPIVSLTGTGLAVPAIAALGEREKAVPLGAGDSERRVQGPPLTAHPNNGRRVTQIDGELGSGSSGPATLQTK
jgi:hypothetical protein